MLKNLRSLGNVPSPKDNHTQMLNDRRTAVSLALPLLGTERYKCTILLPLSDTECRFGICPSFFFRSAYLLYYFDVHQILQQEIPNIPQSEINKRISESWRRLSVAEKAYYLEKAKSEKEGIDTVSVILIFYMRKSMHLSNYEPFV